MIGRREREQGLKNEEEELFDISQKLLVFRRNVFKIANKYDLYFYHWKIMLYYGGFKIVTWLEWLLLFLKFISIKILFSQVYTWISYQNINQLVEHTIDVLAIIVINKTLDYWTQKNVHFPGIF